MSVVYCKKTRRQFLVGTGSTLLAIPFLPSLFSSVAMAQSAAANDRKMMIFLTDHNMLSDYWINPALATTPVGSSGTKEVLLRNLSSLSDVSPMLTESIYNSLRMNNQLTLLRRLNMQAGVGHENLSGMGGSRGDICPTFDTIIEDSPTVYPSTTSAAVTKAIRVDLDESNWLSYRKIGTSLQPLAPYGRARTLSFYNDIFSSISNGTVAPNDMTNKLKSNILNRVFQSFQSFKSSRKISSDDIARLDQHMGFLSDLQKSLNIVIAPSASCTNPGAPIESTDPLIFNQVYLDLLAVAFKCGLTKLGVMKFEGQDALWLPGLALPQGTGLHGGMHGGSTPDLWANKRNAHTTYDKFIYNKVAERFLNSMNVLEGSTGRTYLDNMITAIVPKFGMEGADGGSGHGGDDTQAMLIGSMGGRLRSGRLYNFPEPTYEKRLPHNALFVTLLDLMGVPRAEYAKYSNTGSGWGIYGSTFQNPLAARYYDNLSEIMV